MTATKARKTPKKAPKPASGAAKSILYTYACRICGKPLTEEIARRDNMLCETCKSMTYGQRD